MVRARGSRAFEYNHVCSGPEARCGPSAPIQMKIAAIDLGSNSLHMVLVETLRGRRVPRDRDGEGDGAAGRAHPLSRQAVRLRHGAAGSTPCASTSTWPRARARRRSSPSPPPPSGRPPTARTSSSASARTSTSGRARSPATRRRGSSIWPPSTACTSRAGAPWSSTSAGAASRSRWAAGRAWSTPLCEKLGTLRMTEEFVKSDPLAAKDEERLVKHVQKVLAPHRARMRASGFESAIGTSGTILAVGALALQRAGKAIPDPLHHVTVSAEQIHAARKWLVSSDLKVTAQDPGPGRAPRRHHRRGLGRARHDPAGARGARADPVRMGAARRHPARLHPRPSPLAGARGDLPRRAPPQRGQPGRALPVAGEARAQGRRALPGPVRRHRQAARPGRSGAGAPGVRGDAARHRASHLVPRQPQAHVLPHQERRAARLHARRGGGAGQRGALPPPRPAPQEASGARRAAARPAAHRRGAGRAPPPGRRPRPQPPPDRARPGGGRPRAAPCASGAT